MKPFFLPRLFPLLAWLLVSLADTQAAEPVPKHYNLGADALALQGHDPVAYFTQGKALKGEKTLSATHGGVVYWFASSDHRALFTANPAKYLPT